MEQICLTSLMDINHGLIIFPTWSKMAHGVITWFSTELQTAIEHTLTWLTVIQITLTLLSGLMVTWSKPTHLCWAVFMKTTTSVCIPNKVRLHATQCVISLLHHIVYIESVCHVYDFLFLSQLCKRPLWYDYNYRNVNYLLCSRKLMLIYLTN